MQPVILASSSPRRKELLHFLRISFESISSEVDESIDPDMDPESVVMELAYRKAATVTKDHRESVVIGSDTIVVLDGQMLGKPENRAQAKETLKRLSGQTHEVHTGVALLQGNRYKRFAEKTEVTFWELTDAEIESYLDSGEPFDKAGSYGIQGYGSLLVKEIRGDYYTVVGLPVSRLYRELQAFTS